jgi:RimJ/RimL family protein N-acetyltransferase
MRERPALASDSFAVRPLVATDAEAYVAVRREALEREPLAFSASPADDRALLPEFVRQATGDPLQVLLGAFAPGLVGIVGVYRQRDPKGSHRAQLWGLYVTEAHRGRGMASALVQAGIEFAHTLSGVIQLQLCVTEAAPAAAALYDRAGFVTWGVEPAALRVGDTIVAERHMVLSLERPVGGSESTR